MKKRRIRFALPALALAAALCVGLLLPGGRPSLPDEPRPFAEMQYTRPTPDAFNEHLAAFEAAIGDPDGAKQAMELYELLTDELETVSRAEVLASIHNALDYTDPAYEEELLYCQQLSQSLMDRFTLAVQQGLLSPCGEELRGYFSDEAAEEYLSYSALPAEYFDLAAQEQALIQRYYDEQTAYDTLWLDGEEVTIFDAYVDAYSGTYFHGDEGLPAPIEEAVALRNRELGTLFGELVQVRARIAELRGYETYSDYAYDEIFGRDYTPADSAAFREAVKRELVPLYTALGARLDTGAVQKLNGRPHTADETLDLLADYLPGLSPELADALDYMRANGLCDIAPSPTKFDACFTVGIPGERVPFLFMQGRGDFSDFASLVHEFGHFAAMIYGSDDYWEYGAISLELSEVNSQGLEVLFDRLYPAILGEEEAADDLRAYNLHSMLESVVTGCLFDEFQTAIYETPDMTPEERNALYARLCEEYGLGDIDFLRVVYDWVLIPHNFMQPLYYISYATSATPALELLTIADDDPDRAAAIYMELLYQMDCVDFVAALTDAGLCDPFAEDTLPRLAGDLREHIAALGIDLDANPRITIHEAA